MKSGLSGGFDYKEINKNIVLELAQFPLLAKKKRREISVVVAVIDARGVVVFTLSQSKSNLKIRSAIHQRH
jgi:L-asparaginase II